MAPGSCRAGRRVYMTSWLFQCGNGIPLYMFVFRPLVLWMSEAFMFWPGKLKQYAIALELLAREMATSCCGVANSSK